MLSTEPCKKDYVTESEGGFLYDEHGIAVLDLHGSWHKMGRQYGVLSASRTADVLNYLDKKLGDSPEKTASAYELAEKLYANYPEHLKDFFEGMAETSGLSLERLQLCNAVEYVEGLFFCSAMAAWGGYSGGKLVFGRNYDAESYKEIDKDIIVTVYHPDDGLAAATIGYAGEIYCVNGLNEKGIFVELNNGMPSAGYDLHWELCPGTTALMDVLSRAESLDDMDKFFHETRSSGSFIISVADRHEARSYEWCYDGVHRSDGMTPEGLMTSTNHYVSPQWDFPTPEDHESWNSITRRCNLLERAEEFKGDIGVSRMKAIMGRTIVDGGPWHHLTRYQIIAVPEDMTLHINIPCNGDWAELDMSRYLN